MSIAFETELRAGYFRKKADNNRYCFEFSLLWCFICVLL